MNLSLAIVRRISLFARGEGRIHRYEKEEESLHVDVSDTSLRNAFLRVHFYHSHDVVRTRLRDSYAPSSRARAPGTARALCNDEMSSILLSPADCYQQAIGGSLDAQRVFTHNSPTDYFLPSQTGYAGVMHVITHATNVR